MCQAVEEVGGAFFFLKPTPACPLTVSFVYAGTDAHAQLGVGRGVDSFPASVAVERQPTNARDVFLLCDRVASPVSIYLHITGCYDNLFMLILLRNTIAVQQQHGAGP